MANFTHLRDLYAVPGFAPQAHVQGLFGDPYAVVLPLRRLRKKHAADNAAPATAPSTTKPLARSAISTAADGASISSSPSVASRVGGAAP